MKLDKSSGRAKLIRCPIILAEATSSSDQPRSVSWSSMPDCRSGNISLSIGSSVASKAAIHNMPPPVRASSALSGPVTKG
jgi:hypothetical protein